MQYSDNEGNEKAPLNLPSTEDEDEEEEDEEEEDYEQDIDEIDDEDDMDDDEEEEDEDDVDESRESSRVVLVSNGDDSAPQADKQVRIIPSKTYEVTPMAFSWHGTSVNSVACSYTFKWILSGSEDGWVRIWDAVATYKGAKSVPTHDRPHQPDNVNSAGVLINAFPVSVHERATPDGPFLPSGKGEPASVVSMAVHSEALWALVGLQNGDVNLHTLRHEEGKCQYVLKGHSGRLFAMSLDNSEHRLATGGADKTIRLWDLDTGLTTWTGAGHNFHVISAEFQPPMCHSTLLSTSHDGISHIWDIRTAGEPVMKLLPTRVVKPWAKSSVWSRDGNSVFVSRKTAAFDEYDTRMGGRLVRTIQLPEKTGPVNALLAMPNNKHIICASSDSLRLYNLLNKNETGAKIELEDAAPPPDGAATPAAEDGLSVPYVIIPGRSRSLISQMAIDPSGQFLVTASGTKGLEERTTFSSFGAAAATTTNELLFYNVKCMN